MKLLIKHTINKSNHLINHESKLVFLGSCFAEEIAARFKINGVDVLSNPFGVIFHPSAIASIFINEICDFPIFQRENIFFTYFASSTIYALTKEELVEKLHIAKNNLVTSVQQATHVFITFGTSVGYTNTEFECVVANCHKMPSVDFKKEITSLKKMEEEWNLVFSLVNSWNPACKVILTVSPVRHLKEGLVVNTRSKARLFELVSVLEEIGASYFPSYEICMDELRDYRFFKEDGLHPNKLAVDYCWGKIKETFCDQETNNVLNEIDHLRNMKNHVLLQPESLDSLRFNENKNKSLSAFKQKYPHINWQ